MIQVKICGLSEPMALAAAITAGADHVGFVFVSRSPRNVTLDVAHALSTRTTGQIDRVGVFADPDDALLEAAIRAGQLNVVQLHGDEPPQRTADVRQRFGVRVWKGVGVRTRADVAVAMHYAQAADRVLFDAKASGDLPGGTGVRFDWRLLDGIDLPLPWGLSGGLDAGNVAEAIGVTGAQLIDVSSGVEDAPGIKSAAKIKAFIKAVRDA